VAVETTIHRLSPINENGPSFAECNAMPPHDFIGYTLISVLQITRRKKPKKKTKKKKKNQNKPRRTK
jgi:hypothetical protein